MADDRQAREGQGAAPPVGLVAGATGLTGRHVIEALVRRGGRAVAHVRPDSPRLSEWRERFASLGAEVDTTPWDRAALAETLARVRPDCVFACLGTTRKRGRAAAREGKEETYETVDYGLTVRLLEAAVESGVRPRFVYLSAVGVGPEARSGYYRARWKTEEAVRAAGLPFTIARPSFIVGDRDDRRPAERIGAAVGDAALTLAGLLGARQARDRYASLTGGALGEALVALALDPAAADEVVETAGLRRAAQIR